MTENETIENEAIKRYTDIPALIYMLQKKVITILDPKSWRDKNDTYCLEQYKSRKRLKTLLALCFTEASETYHHWHVFAGGASGVSITFKKESRPRKSEQPDKWNRGLIGAK